jgi:undecaprenyl diphosphate synthase
MLKLPEREGIMHIAIIPDGNRRWAMKNNLPVEEGYKKGINKIKNLAKWCNGLDIDYLSIWILSTENAEKRKEIGKLINLFREALDKVIKEGRNYKVRIRFIGDLSFFPRDVRKKMEEIEEMTKKNKRQILILANYGGRKEILDAIKKIIEENVKDMDEEKFRKYLYAPDVPDPDLIIRTAERRLSGLYPWQGVYSEIYFCRKLWPDFEKKDLIRAIEDFKKRKRKFGK